MAANTSYTMSCDLVYQASATSGGLRLEFTGPATPTNVIYGGYLYKAPGVQEMAVATLYSTSLFGTPFTVSASGTNYISHISATIENGANAGALILLFANIDTSTVKVLRGSWCHVF